MLSGLNRLSRIAFLQGALLCSVWGDSSRYGQPDVVDPGRQRIPFPPEAPSAGILRIRGLLPESSPVGNHSAEESVWAAPTEAILDSSGVDSSVVAAAAIEAGAAGARAQDCVNRCPEMLGFRDFDSNNIVSHCALLLRVFDCAIRTENCGSLREQLGSPNGTAERSNSGKQKRFAESCALLGFVGSAAVRRRSLSWFSRLGPEMVSAWLFRGAALLWMLPAAAF